MNGMDLLKGLGDISGKYYDEGENGAFDGEKQVRTLRRPVLIAAVLALAALLVGCAVVWSLRLQDMSVGKEAYTQSFDEAGKAIAPTEKTRDIITLYGHSGDAIQLALKEWYEFLATYDPDGALMDNNPDHVEIPNRYEYTYSCYTPDMAAKVEEIAAKYNLKLLEEWIPFQQWQSDIFFEETGVQSFLLPDCGAQISHVTGMLYPPYNFDMGFKLTGDTLNKPIWGSIEYARKDYLPGANPGGIDLSNYEQWDHTAPDGTQLLLALGSKGSGYIIAEVEDAMLIVFLEGNFSGSDYPKKEEIMTRQQLETVADLFDYTIRPEISDRATIEKRLAEAEATYQAEHAYVPETYGSFAAYLKDKMWVPEDKLEYAFYDLNGDGAEELLIGRNGAYTEWVTIREGQTQVQLVTDTYLCEGGVEERYSAYEIFESHLYLAPVSETAVDDIGADRKVLTNIRREGEQWEQAENVFGSGSEEITAEEARDIQAQYPRMELDWKPLAEYPLDSDGSTLGDYLEEKDLRVSQEELLDSYRTYLLESKDVYYSHYRILDINSDGVDDLLLSGNGEYFWSVLTYRYGDVRDLLTTDFHLCENGVLEQVETRHNLGSGVEVDGHQFLRYVGFEKELLDFAAFNKATAGWQGDWWNEEPISEAEADSILAKYPRIDQGMQPIEEFLD